MILPYAKYPPLLWPDQYYGYFNAFTAGLAAIGMPMWTLALKKQFDLADTTMIIGALLFSAAKLAFYSLSKTTFEFFAGLFVFYFYFSTSWQDFNLLSWELDHV